MLSCGGECGLEWYLPAFFPRPVTPTQLNPALVFRTQLQWKSSRRITPLLDASLTHYSLWIWEASTAGHTPILRASSVAQQQLCSEDEAEPKTFLCSNLQLHAQTSTLFFLGSGTSRFYCCVPPPKQVCQVSQRAMLVTFLKVIMVTPLCDRNLKTFCWTVSKLSW